jgi:hypothetical protein
MTERPIMNKPSRSNARPLRDLLGKVVGDTFKRQGFASAELVTRWSEIAGADIAALAEPIKVQWPRVSPMPPALAGEAPAERKRAAGTLVLRVEGPAAIEIQHLAGPICERINRFLGWCAIERIVLRQAPLHRRGRPQRRTIDVASAAGIAADLREVADHDLRQALARLGAAVKRG